MPTLYELKQELRRGGHSLVVGKGTATRAFSGRGISDLLWIVDNEPTLLKGASVADKVVGKGAAALMVIGGIAELYAEVVSFPALRLLESRGVSVSYGEAAEMIWNRSRTGRCPVETLCAEAETAEACLPLIRRFAADMAANGNAKGA